MPVPLLLALSLPPLVPLDAEADPAYRKWRDLVAARPHVAAEFKRIEYDEVFETEQHSRGRMVWNGPQDWRLEIEPIDFPKGTKGNRFPLAPADEQEFWIRRDDVLILGAGNKTSTYPRTDRAAPAPLDPQTESFDGMLFEVDFRSAITLIAGLVPEERITSARIIRHRDNGSGSDLKRVVLTPDARLSRQCQSCELLLLPDGRPAAIKLRNPSDNGATVYTIDRWDTSAERHPNERLAERRGGVLHGTTAVGENRIVLSEWCVDPVEWFRGAVAEAQWRTTEHTEGHGKRRIRARASFGQ